MYFVLRERLVLGLLTIATLPLAVMSGAARGNDGGEKFPYKAAVARDRTLVRCGPGDDHYATDELSRGTEIEVYRRAEGGWLAIRPPKSSFSWVAKRDVEHSDKQDVARVVGSAAVSWIGSAVESVQDHRWLIKLDRGEKVVVLDHERRQIVSTGKSDVYVKIVPPSGEFRWVHEDDLAGEGSAAAETIKDPEVALADFRVALRGTPRPAPVDDAPALSQPAAGKEPVDAAAGKKDDFMSRSKSAGLAGAASSSSRHVPRAGASSDRASAPTGAAELESRLRELEAALSLAVSQPAQSWELEKLRESAEQLASEGKSTLERARIQLYLDKLAEFEQLKSRHALLDPKAPSLITAIRSRLTGDPPPADSDLDPRFDGKGWLLPVHSAKSSSPPYALLDSDGNILQFVSPAPGLNLNRYLKKEIGVIGQRDQASTLDKPHLTAQRVVELGRHRR
jgi:uncharacterized protein YgiM (DUF1202 family)